MDPTSEDEDGFETCSEEELSDLGDQDFGDEEDVAMKD